MQRPVHASFSQPVPVPEYELPKGKTSGGFYVLDQAAVIKATKSAALNKFVTIGTEPFHLSTNRSKIVCLLKIIIFPSNNVQLPCPYIHPASQLRI